MDNIIARKPTWRLLSPVAIFVGALGLFLPPSLLGINIFDEGVVVTGAMQVLHGKLPYRDFFSLYGPGQFYLTAGLFAVFGEELVTVRIAHAVLLAGLAVTVFGLSRIASGNQRGIPTITVLTYAGITLYAQPNVGYPPISAGLALLLAALVFGQWVLKQRCRILGIASFLVGVAGTFRWDFGVFGIIALAITVAGIVLPRPTASSRPVALALCATGPALGIMAVVYVPLLVLLSDPTRWYQEVLRYSLVEFPKWRNLEYLRPSYWALASSWRDGDGILFSRSVLQISYVLLPSSLTLATLAVAGLRLLQRKEHLPDRASAQSFLVGLLSLFLLNQMRVRPHLFQGFPAIVASLPLLPFLLGALQAHSRFRPAIRIAGSIGGFVLSALLFHAAFINWMHAIDSRAIALNVTRAGGVRVEPAWAYFAELVDYIRSRTSEGEAIYSGVIDHSRLFINDCMLYFLANRPPADRFGELEPGISNTRTGQHEIRRALQDKSVRLVVLLDRDTKEPNLTSTSNGVHDLDDFLVEHYRPSRQFGPYTVLEAK